jgi:uncharacterized membrane protein
MITMNLRYIILLIALLAALPSPVAAYYGAAFEITSEMHQVCPCDIITSDEIVVELLNYGTKSDTYFLSMEVPDGWTGFITPDVTLASGEKTVLDPMWVTPPCGTEPGKYTVRFTAESAQSGKIIEEELELDVMRCHDVGISGENYVSTCEAEEVTAQAVITNHGKIKETFVLTASPSWVRVSPDSASISPWDSKTVSLIINPPEGLRGDQEITLSAESTLSYASAERKITLDIDQCYLFGASVVPPEDTVCIGRSSEYQLYIDNRGTKSDTYRIVTPAWITAEKSTVTLGSGRREVVSLTATPPSRGEKKLDVYVSSVNNPTSIVEAEGLIAVVDCSGVVVSFSSPERNVCRGESTDFVARIENTGTVVTAYTIESSGKLSREKLVLSPGEAQNVILGVTATEKEGIYPVTINVFNGGATDQDSARLVVHRCHEATLDVSPVERDICEGDTLNYEVRVKNTGELDDRYELAFPGGEREFDLQPGDSIRLKVDIPFDESWTTSNELKFRLRSAKGFSTEKTVSLNVTSEDVCFDVDMNIINGTGGKEKRVTSVIGEGQAVEMRLINKGIRSDTYEIVVNGPDWAYLSEETVHLTPLQEKTVYLYISPPFDTEEMGYDLTVLADSGKVMSGVEVRALVVEQLDSEETQEGAGEGAELTGGLAGMFAAQPFSVEATLIGALAFFTALLIVLRFVIFR